MKRDIALIPVLAVLDACGKLVCTGGAMGATTMTMNGTYTMEEIEMTMAGELSQPQIPGGKANIEMKITSEHAGDCKS